MIKESSIGDFIQALQLLDKELDKLLINKIEIRAIGGFAMLYHDIHEHGFTIDIDSLTEGYDENVQRAICKVGKELNLEEDWLNSDCAMLDGFLDELAMEIQWEKSKYLFQHIDLKVADTLGLIRSKAKAIHDGGLVPRFTDKRDIVLLLKSIGIGNIQMIDESKKLDFLHQKYPRCYTFLKEKKQW